MIDIPIGKALVAVPDLEGSCGGCFFYEREKKKTCTAPRRFGCTSSSRKDRKSVIFKLVDYPVQDNLKPSCELAKETE